MNVSLTINHYSFHLDLENNETVEQLINELPLTLHFKELNNNEKYATLPKPLPTNSIQIDSIENGEIMLFGKRTIVLFYQDFKTKYTYTRHSKS